MSLMGELACLGSRDLGGSSLLFEVVEGERAGDLWSGSPVGDSTCLGSEVLLAGEIALCCSSYPSMDLQFPPSAYPLAAD